MKFAKHLPGEREEGIVGPKDSWTLGPLRQERVAAIFKWGTHHLNIAATLSFSSLPLRLRPSVVNLDFRYCLMAGVLVISMLVFSVCAMAADDADIAAVYTAVPSAKFIDETAAGYRVTTADGKTVFVDKTSTGYRISGDKSTAFIDRKASGFRVSNGGATTFIDKTSTGYRVPGGKTTTFMDKTSSGGYRITNGSNTTVISKNASSYRVSSGR